MKEFVSFVISWIIYFTLFYLGIVLNITFFTVPLYLMMIILALVYTLFNYLLDFSKPYNDNLQSLKLNGSQIIKIDNGYIGPVSFVFQLIIILSSIYYGAFWVYMLSTYNLISSRVVIQKIRNLLKGV